MSSWHLRVSPPSMPEDRHSTLSLSCPSIRCCPTTHATIRAISAKPSSIAALRRNYCVNSTSSSSMRYQWSGQTSSTSLTKCCASTVVICVNPLVASSCCSSATSSSWNPLSRKMNGDSCSPSTHQPISSLPRCGRRCSWSASNCARCTASATQHSSASLTVYVRMLPPPPTSRLSTVVWVLMWRCLPMETPSR